MKVDNYHEFHESRTELKAVPNPDEEECADCGVAFDRDDMKKWWLHKLTPEEKAKKRREYELLCGVCYDARKQSLEQDYAEADYAVDWK